MAGPMRLQRHAEDLGVPGLEQLGHYRYRAAQESLPAHVHDGCAEICLLVSGEQRYRLNGRVYALRGGDQFVSLPGESHDTAGTPEERGELYWVVVRLDADTPSWLHLDEMSATLLREAINSVPARQFASHPGSAARLAQALQLIRPDASPLELLKGAGLVVQFLLDTVAAARESQRSRSPVVERAQRHLQENLDRRVLVSEVAAVSGCSAPHLHALFREQVGMPPAEFHMRARIGRAQQLLAATTLTVTEISQLTGFASSQHFATTFRRFVRKSPREFRSTHTSDRASISSVAPPLLGDGRRFSSTRSSSVQIASGTCVD